MPLTVTLFLDTDYYDIFSDETVVGIALTERDAAIVNSAIAVLLNRSLWQDMSDAEWDDWSSRIAIIQSEFL